MYGNPQRRTDLDVQERRQEGGRWLKELREHAGLSQREMASLVKTDYYTFISQLENGRGRVPPDCYHAWAGALGVAPRQFVKNILKYYDPVTFEILFEE
jgi:transcriptional regulator with XRE-family HTH domain